MALEYKVDAFIPTVSGCGAQDMGWDAVRCKQFQDFLNGKLTGGWKLHSSEYRSVTAASACGGKSTGAQLICIFERGSQ